MIRVAIADDQAMVRAGFRMIVASQKDMEVAGEAADGQEAIELVRREKPDVVLMDVRMPRLDGIAATRQVADATRVVILTTFELDEYVFDALAAGASAFLLKAAPPEDLIKAIRIVAAAKNPKQLESLTERELEVLREVARGLSNSEIAQRLHVSETTVKTHVAHLLDKLELRDRVQAVILAYEAGLAG